ATSATDLVRQLLAFSRREAVKPKVIDVGRLVGNMRKLLQRTAGPDIDLVIDGAATGRHVLIDPSQLEQIVMNLVVNARDAITGPGRIVVRVGTERRFSTIEVIDT